MEITTLIGKLILDATLIRTRINNVDARFSSHESPAGGLLSTETSVGLSGSTKVGDEHIASVTIKIEGFPKGTNRENAKTTTAIFSISVSAQGTYKLTDKVPKELQDSQELAYALGRPIYVIAASEARAIAVKMGLPGVRPEVDIAKPKDGELVATEDSTVINGDAKPVILASKAPKSRRIAAPAKKTTNKSVRKSSKD